MSLKQTALQTQYHFKDLHDNPPKGFNPDALPKEFWDEHARLYEPFFTNPNLSREERKKHYKEIFDKLEKSGKYKTARERNGDVYNMKEENDIKNKIDNVLAKKEEPKKEVSDKPSVWTPFAKKIYADMEIYFHKLDGASPTRAVATKFRNEIDTKLEDGKEKDGLIKFYNKRFKLPGVSTKSWNYFSETIIDLNANEKEEKELIKKVDDYLSKQLGDSYDEGYTLAKAIIDIVKNFNKKESNDLSEKNR